MPYQKNNLYPRVAYFSMEFGLDPSLPIYAGGLGILAGDYLKAAHDLELPLIGIGLLWRNDYTEQFIGADGYPYDTFSEFDAGFLRDTGKEVELEIKGNQVVCKIYFVDQFKNAPLYLLDTGYPGSPNAWITSKLYQSEPEVRIAQEMILGIGGVRALRALGIDVDVYHFNEGHAVLAGLELIREKMETDKVTFAEALQEVREKIVFTTHTPVEAGNEKHNHALLQRLGAYNGLNYEEMKAVGEDPFNMTIAALRLSCVTNGVSKLHGQTTREMWCDICGTLPIISITNGVHVETWQDKRIRHAFQTGGSDLFETHQVIKRELLNYVREKKGVALKENNLLIGFARRAAPYKRSDLIFRDIKAIEGLLKENKLQLIFSGKAHPDDKTGKELIRLLVQQERNYPNSVIFLENYDMGIAKLLVKGCDVWLNNPIRPLEASGTSGMKAAMNGVLNLSVVDGWVAEGPQHGISGWLLDQPRVSELPQQERDRRDLMALYKVLLEEVLPTYYNNKKVWEKMMYNSIDMSHWQFSSKRMI
ncbi:MAG TPA: alpha-glucan family phosphorylase, partial [Firmicutes bacterium]|nr:alpha-glucan family phosphorylase [Bacillota bacterium]